MMGVFGRPALKWTPIPHMMDWVEWLKEERSESYSLTARSSMARFAQYCNHAGITHPDEIERRHLVRYQDWLREQKNHVNEPLAPSYQSGLLRMLRLWLEWLVDRGVLEESPWRDLVLYNPKSRPVVLTMDEIMQLFDQHRQQAFTMSPFYYHRREALLVALYGWGLRLDELTALTVGNLDVRQETIRMRNAHGDIKSLPYTPEIKQTMQRWLAARASKAMPGEDALFIDRSGRRVTADMVRKTIHELGHRAGLTVGPRRLRATFGYQLLEANVDPEKVADLMGNVDRWQNAHRLRNASHKEKELIAAHEEVMGPVLREVLNVRPRRRADPPQRPDRAVGDSME